MLDNLWLDLQLFGDGGDGGSAGDGGGEASGEASADATAMDAELARVPERARDAYKKALEKNKKPAAQKVQPTDEPKQAEKPSHVAYADLIKSDEYKEEHKAYMDKTIKDRFKKYEGMEASNAKMQDMLSKISLKYGLNPDSESFMDDLSARIDADDSFYEDYAMEHDISVDEARKNIELERKVRNLEAMEEQRRHEIAQAEAIRLLRENAERTKAEFPEFDLETEMQNEQFRRQCAITNGDTTAAYVSLHYKDIVTQKVAQESQKAKQAIAQSIATNGSRPLEGGLSNQPAATIQPRPYNNMSARELKAYANQYLRK